MKHPSWEELSAYLDNALDTHRWAKVARHLEDCQGCRDDLAELESEHRALERTLDRDPGEAYFDTFHAGVEARLSVEGGRRAPSSVLRGFGRWWESPARLALAGSVAAVVVVAGALAVMRPWEKQVMRDETLAGRAGQVAPAPAGPKAEGAEEAGGPPGAGGVAGPADEPPAGAAGGAPPGEAETAARAESDAAAQAAVRPARAHEVRRDAATGEDVRVAPPGASFNEPPAGERTQPTTLSDLKRQTVKPLDAQSKEAAPAPAAGLAPRAPSQRPGTPAGGAFRPEAQAPGRVCGEVRDASGRALQFASVILKRGNVVQTDAAGRFCVSGPPGPDTLIVSLVGFHPARAAVRVSADIPEIAVRLVAVSPLEKLSLGGASRPRAEAAPRAESSYPFDVLPDSLRAIATGASQLLREGTDRRQAEAFDASAREWARLLRHVVNTPLELDVRFRYAEARYRAWEIAPTTRRTQDATEALTFFLTRASAGPQRDRAVEWLDQVRR